MTDTSKLGVNVDLCGTELRHYGRFGTQQPPRKLIQVTRSYLHRSDPFFTLGLGDGPPLAPHARFVARNSVHGCDGREEKSKKRVLH